MEYTAACSLWRGNSGGSSRILSLISSSTPRGAAARAPLSVVMPQGSHVNSVGTSFKMCRDPSTCSCCNGTIPTRQVGDVVECLQALLQFSFHRLGVPYKTDNANQQEIVNHLAFIGMVVKVSKTDGDTYCITSLTKKWAAGGKYGEQAAMLPSGSIPGAMCSTANDAGYIIVETTNR
eukprot:gene25650-1719_t